MATAARGWPLPPCPRCGVGAHAINTAALRAPWVSPCGCGITPDEAAHLTAAANRLFRSAKNAQA